MNPAVYMDLNEKTLSEVCCSCAKLFDTGVCLLDPSQHRLAKWLKVNLDFEAKKDSKLPTNLCIDCIQDIRRWMIFRERCMKTARLLQKSAPVRSVSPTLSTGSNEVTTTSDMPTSKPSMMSKWLASGKTSARELQVKLSRVAIKSEPMDEDVSEMPQIKVEPKLEPKVEPDSNMEAQNIQNLSKSLTNELQKQASKPYKPGPKSKTRVPENAEEMQGLSKNLSAALTQKMNRPMPASHKKRLQTQKQIKEELESDDSDDITEIEQPPKEVPSTTVSKPPTHGQKQLSIMSFMSPSARSPPAVVSKPAISTQSNPKPSTVTKKSKKPSGESTKKVSAGKRKSKYTSEAEDAILSAPSTTFCVVCRAQVPSGQLSKHPCFLGQTP